jgi:membrane protein DedA with SNARE-associated domain
LVLLHSKVPACLSPERLSSLQRRFLPLPLVRSASSSLYWRLQGGAIVGDGIGYMVGRRFGLPLIRRYGRYIRLDENRLLIGRYLFFRYGNVVVFFGRFVAVLRIFAALLAGANRMPAGRFFFFNITGGVCWACLFGFGAYAVGAGIYTISGTLSVISLGVLIATAFALSIFMRRNEVTLRRRAELALSDHSR